MGRSRKCRLAFLTFFLLAANTASLIASSYPVVIVKIEGRIDEGAKLLVERGVRAAIESRASHVVIVLDTYGGYLYSLDDIVRILSLCTCKRVTWIPPGGKAISAGAIIALSTDEIYVGGGSVLGACEPRPSDGKVVQYVKARIRAFAQERGLNMSTILLLEEMVTKNRAFSSSELLRYNLASGRAESLDELLKLLGVQGAVIVIEPDIVTEIYSILFDPGLALLLLVAGVLFLLLELKATGFQGWGILGGFLVAASLYSMGIIGWSILTLALILIGLFALIVELKAPGIQVFGIAGIALIMLATVLEYWRRPFVNIASYSIPIVLSVGALSSFLFWILIKAEKAVRLRKPSIEDRLVGKVGRVKKRISPGSPGVLNVEGEDWSAISKEDIEVGGRARVIAVKGLVLEVEKVD